MRVVVVVVVMMMIMITTMPLFVLQPLTSPFLLQMELNTQPPPL